MAPWLYAGLAGTAAPLTSVVLQHGVLFAGKASILTKQQLIHIARPSLGLRQVIVSSQLYWYFSSETLAALTERVSGWCETFLNLCRIQSLLLKKGQGGAEQREHVIHSLGEIQRRSQAAGLPWLNKLNLDCGVW